MTQAELHRHLESTLPHTSAPIRRAILAIKIDGMTWRDAATRYKVTESGILKAMQRGKVREFTAGTVNPID